MAKLTALPAIDVIRGYKGVLDFYVRRGTPCVRRWPYTPRSKRTAGTIAAAATFGQILKSYRLTADTILEAYQELARGIPRTPRDIYVSAILGHLHERTEPDVPPTIFTTWSPDAPPLIPSALDDEFDDASFDTDLWTEFDPGTVLAISENQTGLLLDLPSQGANNLCGLYQAIPPVDFSIVAKLALLAPRANFGVLGLGLWQDATNVAAGLYWWQLTSRNADQQMELTRWTNYTTWAATLWNQADALITTCLYMRVRRVAATYSFDWSLDGLGWQQISSGALAWVPLHFGILITNVGTGVIIRGVSTFFRYTPYGTANLLLQGDRIREQRNN